MTTDKLPPLPAPLIVLCHTPGEKLAWGAQMREYGQICRQQALESERAAFKAFLREMHADHNDQHNHFHYALNEWVRRTEQTQTVLK